MMDAAEKILELRRIEQEIAEHRSAISSLEHRRLEVLEMVSSRLDPRRRISDDDRRRILAAACSGRKRQ